MLPCEKCAYKTNIPGNCHIGCDFAWFKASPEVMLKIPVNHNPKVSQWFDFPLNYDPVWGPDECPAFATQRDEAMVNKLLPLHELARLLGR